MKKQTRVLMCRVRSDILGHEKPPILNANRVDEDKFLECLDWMECLSTKSFEDHNGIIRDEDGFDSVFTLRFRLPTGEIVWGMNVDFDVERRFAKKLTQEDVAALHDINKSNVIAIAELCQSQDQGSNRLSS